MLVMADAVIRTREPVVFTFDDLDESTTVENFLQMICQKYVDRLGAEADERIVKVRSDADKVRRQLELLVEEEKKRQNE